jgi:hypothetical protein
MSKFAIRLLTLATYATTLVVVPMVTPAEASSSRHIKKHKKIILSSPGFSYHRSAGQAWAFTGPPNQAGPVCPGMGRSFDCKVWPPPIDEDPDRTIGDGGGM